MRTQRRKTGRQLGLLLEPKTEPIPRPWSEEVHKELLEALGELLLAATAVGGRDERENHS